MANESTHGEKRGQCTSISGLAKEQLWELRGSICLGSMFLGDYCNDFGVDPKEAMEFFEGYESYLKEIMSESIPGFDGNVFRERLGEFDTSFNLAEWGAICQGA